MPSAVIYSVQSIRTSQKGSAEYVTGTIYNYTMTQSILTDDGFETDSELKRLYRLRTAYYTELLSEMDLLRRKRVDLIKSFKIEVWDIDKQITRAKHREQHE